MEDASPDDLSPPSPQLDGDAGDGALSQDFIDSPTEPSPAGASGTDAAAKTNAPLQKRRRVTRACDECRRKKIKCDGKLPCTHCTVYSYECTYDQPSNRRRNATPQHIEALEQRLKRAEGLLHMLLPNIDLSDPNIEASVRNGQLSIPMGAAVDSSMPSSSSGDAPEDRAATLPDGSIDAELESMVKTTGQLDIDEQGNWDYRGHSSGLSFVRRMREQLGDIMGPQGRGTPFVKAPVVQDSPKSNILDSPSDTAFHIDLPPRETARELCRLAIDEAAALLRVTHSPSFFEAFDRLYETSPENYAHEETSFLPLLYSMLALGTLFYRDTQSERQGYKSAIDEGYKYFRMCRQSLDVAESRTLQSLQAVVYMILFLQSSAKLSTCYSYIGIALRSAIRMGLHRSLPESFNPIESETRKRTFWVIQKMDIYVGALLGLPHSMSDDDIDQELPTEVDDEFITEKGILPMPEGRMSIITASNAHTRLVNIIGKIVRYIYPVKAAKSNLNPSERPTKNYTVSYMKIREIEKDLQEWMENLPMGLKPGGEAAPLISRVQQLLRMAYAHAQVMLYRPFLHYVSQTHKNKPIDKRSYACAATCVSVSRNIIHIAIEMKRQSLLIGAYWFTMYTTFFAILSLVFFVLENPDNAASQDLLRDVFDGKETLEQLAKRSMAADRCSTTLKALFDRLPDRLKKMQANGLQVPVNRKRRSEFQQHTAAPVANIESAPVATPRRANTFPDTVSSMNRNPSYSYSSINHSQPQAMQDATMYSPTRQEFVGQQMNVSPPTPSAAGFSYGATAQHQPPQRQATMPLGQTDFVVETPLIHDVSAIMFPSTDPFAYPTQPITTIDNVIFQSGLNFQPPQSRGNSMSGNFTNTSSSGGQMNSNASPETAVSGEVDMHLLGPMPMYMTQGSQFSQGARQHVPPIDGTGSNGVNLDELFGAEEWAGMFSDYGQWGQLEMGYAG